LVLQDFPETKAILINPDVKDLNITKKLFSSCGLDNRCCFLNEPIDRLHLTDNSFDLITSMSAVEHIPEDGDMSAVKNVEPSFTKRPTVNFCAMCQ
jgi:ubiquinone/menaquinone biosynthesis C-methylase UbiE